jgi:hypothetical protein
MDELLDAAFSALQHDTGEHNPEFEFLRQQLREKFTAILTRQQRSSTKGTPSDSAMLDWLETKVVNVRHDLRYGSRDMFWTSPEDLDGDTGPSDIRERIKEYMAIEQSTPKKTG